MATPARIALALGLGGFGSGLFLVANMHYVMAALSPSRQGMAGSVVALMRTAGVVVGANVTTAVYAARLSAHAHLGEGGAASSAFTDAFSVAAAIAGGRGAPEPGATTRARCGRRLHALTPLARPVYTPSRRRRGSGARTLP